ncbi:MAG: LacI family DNA-binding transcriptional regulator [Flavobacteriaceae bacterium]
MKNLTLKDIAAALNLSITTVSKALKDYPDVNTNTKERVKAYAKKVNFTPNAHAAFLRTQQSKLIGVVIPRLNHFFFSNVLRGIMKAAEEEDYMVIVLSSDESYELEKKQINRLLQQNVDGILLSIADSTHDTKHIDAIIEQKIPLIFFDKYSKLNNCSSVVINDQKAAFNAVEHLIKQGKKNIAHLRGPLLPQNSIDRFLGYRKALEQYGLEYRKEWVFTCDQISNEEGYAYTQEIIEKHPEIDAIFAVADMPAVGAIKCLNEQKIVIPDQIAVMGFSNWRISNLVTPTLSTVNQPGIEMGEKAFELFYKEQQLIKKGESVVYEKIELDTKLIIRQSS